ncbi:chromosomal replication initiator protein DnaA [Candidatus Dependentiae bacterium Noda2021]|nr:chromosomal replication initiator protein DnaA [Candidatus Dependentiae bacterium Noda2021]
MVRDVWSEFLVIAKEEVGSRIVETWFRAVTFNRWDSYQKIVYLQAPNQFIKGWVQSHYTALIETHLKRLLYVNEIKIVFDDQQAQEEAAHQPAEVVLVKPAVSAHSNTVALHKKEPSTFRSYTFDNFVVGPNNSLAYAAAQAVAEKPGEIYNPLFVYGNSGLGKTHLLHAIGAEIKEKNKRCSVLYQTADRFVNEFINAIRFDKVHNFQAKYKAVDVLLIDDIQFISNKEQTQEAFFHIFNALYDAQKQIIFSSDTFPQDMKGLAERLKYRLAWGLVVDMHLPTLETKIAIIKKKAEMSNNECIDDDVAHFIASRTVSNVRELEGSLIRVMAFASLTQQPVTLELAKKVLSHTTVQKNNMPIGFDHVIKCVNKYYHYNIDDLRSKQRSKELSFARQIAMFLMKKVTDKSLRDIGMFLGGRDHSTVMHALDKISQQAQRQQHLQNQLKQMEDEILSPHV